MGRDPAKSVKIPLCVPPSLHGPANVCLSNIYFPSSCELSSLPLKPQTTTRNLFFCFQLKTVFKVSVSAILVSYPVFLGLLRVYTLLNFRVIFSRQFNAETSQNQEGQGGVPPDTHFFSNVNASCTTGTQGEHVTKCEKHRIQFSFTLFRRSC